VSAANKRRVGVNSKTVRVDPHPGFASLNRPSPQGGGMGPCSRHQCSLNTTVRTSKNHRLFCPTSQARATKIFVFPKVGSYDLKKPARLDTRDVRPIVSRREAGCDGRSRCADDVHRRVRSSRVVLIPRRWDQTAQEIARRRGLESPVPRGEHGVSRKAIAQGVPA
jgi:hypothetical protein